MFNMPTDIAESFRIRLGVTYRDRNNSCLCEVTGFPREWTTRREMVAIDGECGKWILTRAQFRDRFEPVPPTPVPVADPGGTAEGAEVVGKVAGHTSEEWRSGA
jgi:hypothetical protein